MTLRFSDGMTFNTDGPYRIVRKSDGLYVVGQGFLCAVDTDDEGLKMIAELKDEKRSAK